MKKILILPFLQMPSGHHQVADAISAYIKEIDDSVEIKKVDIFHYTSPLAEKMACNLYLKSIKMAPSFYSWLYRQNACRSSGYEPEKHSLLYEWIFLKSMDKLVKQEEPDIIICTHCLPSYLLNVLKKREQLSIPIVNAYTDYFINTVWGISHIDLHLVPSNSLKKFLELQGVSSEKIALTGIPVHPKITIKKHTDNLGTLPFHIIVSGGNLGVGPIEKIIKNSQYSGKIKYFILCGKNRSLYKRIEKLQNPSLVPISYISLREEMNHLYQQMDLMLSKPGGITISECFRKEIPLCLLDALPGPEEKNQQYLLEENLAIKINLYDLENSLLLFLEDKKKRLKFQNRLSSYINQQEDIRTVLKNFMMINFYKNYFY